MFTQRDNSGGSEPIAIIGTGCRFPGGSSSPSKLWDLLKRPRDLLTEIPSERFNAKGFHHPNPLYHGHSNVLHSYLLDEDTKQFDAQFFGIKPLEAAAIDPQQRLLLETVYEGLESAGIPLETLKGSDTAVYVGLMCNDYEAILLRDLQKVPTYHATGIARSIMSNRISYFFDWHGPSMTIDTACSSSLIAVHQAVQTLRSGNSRVALACGSNLILGPENYVAESKLKMLSPDGRSRMWDSKANGYARGEGVAAVVLKTLSAALEDGDHIECLIRETGTNQDGRTRGITMPSAEAQTNLIRHTYAKAGLNPLDENDRCQYFEAHGTGTPAGDPIEAEAIKNAFFDNEKPQHRDLYVGSIKTIVGHTEGTAGLAAVIKASLAIQNSTIPPNMLFNELNPNIVPFYDNLEVPTSAKQWPTHLVRRASVNSFGFGGSNAHAILESYQGPAKPQDNSESITVYAPYVFSATSEKSLSANLTAFSDYLSKNTSVNADDLAYTLHSRRSALPLKTWLPTTSISKLEAGIRSKVEEANKNEDIGIRSVTSKSQNPRILGIFTGQGAQYARMGAELIESSPFARGIIQTLEQALKTLPRNDRPSWSLFDELCKDQKLSKISQASISQPLCTAVQILLVDILKSIGIQLVAVVGHSSGEIGAAYAAGYLTAQDAIRIAYYRGHHSTLAGTNGAMLAVGTSLEDATELCESEDLTGRLVVAASNSPSSVTLSGDTDAVEEAEVIFGDENKFRRRLKVDKAYHSHHMLACSESYIASLQDCEIEIQNKKSDCDWYSSVYPDTPAHQLRSDLKDIYWDRNMVKPVLFSQAIQKAIAADASYDLVIEVGPHPALKGPALQSIQETIPDALPYTGLLSRGRDAVEAMSDALGFLWAHLGASTINLTKYQTIMSGEHRSQVIKGLPSYQWTHERSYWHESRTSKAMRTRSTPVHELLGDICPDSSPHHLSWRHILSANEIPWIKGHQLQNQTVFPAAGYLSTALEAGIWLSESSEIRLMEVDNFVIHQALAFTEEDSGIEVLFDLNNILRPTPKTITAHFTYSASAGKNRDTLGLFASGELKLHLGEAMSNTLPARSPPEPNMIEINDNHFYGSLEELGYGYTGPFRALSSIERKLGKASGSIAVTQQHDSPHCLLVHPAMLDAAIQSVILAFSYPHDGQLWSLHVPTSIRKIRINPTLCMESFHGARSVPFDASITVSDPTGVTGDVEIYEREGTLAAVQLEGVKAVPFAPATADNDKEIFSHVIWAGAKPDGEAAAYDFKASKEDYELATALERISLFYLRVLDGEIPQQHPARFDGPYVGLFNYANHVIATVMAGKHRYAKSEWIHDSIDLINEICDHYHDSPDVKMMRVVGEQMPRVIREETTILEHAMKDGILDNYYVNALGFPQFSTWLGRMAKQITHRFPRMNILEIGAGTGGATKSILKEIEKDFSSYTFTDISNGFFDKAQEVFANHKDKMTFKALDIEKDIPSQGFADNSYDLIVASFVIHATSKLERTMKNVRRLLKPGGFVLLAEVTDNNPIRGSFTFGAFPGWWLGADDGRIFSPCVSPTKWDSVFRKTGFSGIDTITPDSDIFPFPGSVFVTQAVTDEIQFLRQPLSPPLSMVRGEPVIHDLTIIGGATLRTARLVTDLESALRQFCSTTHRVDTIEELDHSQVTSNSTILCLTELDHPVFKDLTPQTFESLKMIFGSEKTIVWVTEGRRANNPYSNMTVGFGRSLLWEVPDLRLQFVDLEDVARIDSRIISEALLRFQAGSSWQKTDKLSNMLWSVEPELIVHQNGSQLIPRLDSFREANDRYNSVRRPFNHSSTLEKCCTKLINRAEQRCLVDSTREWLQNDSEADQNMIEIRTLYSTSSAIKTVAGNFYLIIGSTKSSSKADCVALSIELASKIRLTSSYFVVCDIPSGQEAQFLRAIAAIILAETILNNVPSGSSVVTLDAPDSVLDALSIAAASRRIQSVALTSNPHLAVSARIHVNAYTPQRKLNLLIGTRVAKYVNFSSHDGCGDIGKRIASSLPRSCELETNSSVFRSEAMTLVSEEVATASILKITVDKLGQLGHGTLSRCNDRVVTLQELIEMDDSDKSIHIVSWVDSSSVQTSIQPIDSQKLFRDDRTYWLVGLSGGLGLSLCDWIIRNGGKYVVISSRNPKINPAWLEETQAKGATVKIYANDVTSEQQVQTLYDELVATLPPIAGVAQGAMVLRDTPTRDMTYENMVDVLRPKVDGSVHLDRLFHETPLDFFVYFSSMTGVVGNIGQSNYTAANTFMCSLAAQRKKRGLNASVLNIGAIIGVGYVTREVGEADQKNLQKGGYMWLAERDFHQMFAEAVLFGQQDASIEPELSTGLRHIKDSEPYLPVWHNNPRFARFVVQESSDGGQVNATKVAVSIKARLHDAQSDADVHSIIEETLLAKLRAMLQLEGDDDAAMLKLRTDELGLDSLIAVDLRSWFLKNFQVNMPVLKILGGVTIADMIVDAQQSMPTELAPNARAGGPVTQSKVLTPKIEIKAPAIETANNSKPHTPENKIKPSAIEVASKPIPQSLTLKDSTTAVKNNDRSATEIPKLPIISEVEPIQGYFQERPRAVATPGTASVPTTPVPSDVAKSEIGTSGTATPASSVFDADEWEGKHSKPVIARSAALSFCQSMFWFVDALMEDKTTLNHTGYFKMKGSIRVHSLELAVRALGYRHEALRTCFIHEGDQILQAVLENPTLTLEHHHVHSIEEVKDAYESLRKHVYDLSSGQTMRIRLLSLSSSEHYFLIGCHHINVDGISQQVIMADLEKLYEGKVLDHKILQYIDYSTEQQRQLQRQSWMKELKYWTSEFSTLPEPLPTKFSPLVSRQTLKTYSVHEVKLRVDKDLTAKIREVCRSTRVTAFHFYLTAFKILLHHFTGAQDVCIGTCDAGRHEENMLASVGPFINLVPIRFGFNSRQVFSDALVESKSKSHAALANSKVPFEVLLNELRVVRSPTHSPLFQAFIDYRQGAQERQRFASCSMEMMNFEPGRTAYDISLDIIDNSGGDALIMLMLQQDLYSSSQAQLLTRSLDQLLRICVFTPSMEIGRVPPFAPSDVAKAVSIGRGIDLPSQWPATLIHRVEEIAVRHSAKVAINHADGPSLTYCELMQQTNTVVAALLDAGVGHGTIVAVYQEPSPAWICSMLAIMKIGAVYVPLDSSLPLERLALIVEDCQPALILFDHNTKPRVSSLSPVHTKGIDVSTLGRVGHDNTFTTQACATDLALILYTSGSTGKPKGVLLKHSSFKNEIEVSTQIYGLNGNDVVLQQSSLGFDMSVLQIFLALSLGGKLVTTPRSMRGDSVAIARLISLEGITYTCATPSEYTSWLHHGSTKDLRSSQWRVALSGGEAVTDSLLENFKTLQKHDLHLFNGYGPTETTCCSTKTDLNYNDPELYKSDITAGKASPNESIYIMDEHRRLLPPGLSGEIVIGGVGVAAGYLNSHQLTSTAFLPDINASQRYMENEWIHMYCTGDRGRLLEDGSLIVEGRLRDDTQIKLRGLRIDLQDVEQTILRSSEGRLIDAVVSVRSAKNSGSKFLVAHVVVVSSMVAGEQDYLSRLPSQLPLPQYMRPSIILPLHQMPMTASGKIDRKAIAALPLPILKRSPTAEEHTLTDIESKLKALWYTLVPQDIAGSESISRNTDFFHVGGNSMLLVELQGHIRKAFDLQLTLIQLFESSTLGCMASLIDKSMPVSEKDAFNWDEETRVSDQLSLSVNHRSSVRFVERTGVIILTGATGFLGQYLLQKLVADPQVKRIHCIGVRQPSQKQHLINHAKIRVHEGDLVQPRLGLSERDAQSLFAEADALIHNGADVSHLKTYKTLKQANVTSTEELVKLCLGRKVPFHYVSSGMTAMFREREEFAEVSVRDSPPPIDGLDGYPTTKWVAEVFLENVSKSLHLPVYIHRPSSVVKPGTQIGDDTLSIGLLQNLMNFSRALKAIPISANLQGTLDFISPEHVVDTIVTDVLQSQPAEASKVTYRHCTGDLVLPIRDMQSYLQKETGEKHDKVSIVEWANRAEKAGLHPAAAEAFRKLDHSGMWAPPRYIKSD